MPHKVDPTLRPFYTEVYAAIRQCQLDFAITPSQEELRNAVGCSMTTVIKALKDLRQKGYITQPKFGQRAIKLVDPDLTLSHEPLDPWLELTPKKYFRGVRRKQQ